MITGYDPAADDSQFSLREVGELLDNIGPGDLPTARRYVQALVDGDDPEAAWKAAGLPGRFDPDASPVKRVFAGRPRGLFDR